MLRTDRHAFSEAPTVESVMTRQVETATPDTPVTTILERMASCRISCVVVEAGDRICGIFSEHEVLRLLTSRREGIDRLVLRDVMVTPVPHVSPEAMLSDAAEVMRRRRLCWFPVADAAHRLVGLVTQADVLCGLQAELSRHADNLEQILARRTRRLRRMKQIAEQCALLGHRLKTLDLDHVLDTGAAGLPELFGAAGGFITLRSPQGQAVVVRQFGTGGAEVTRPEQTHAMTDDVTIESDGASGAWVIRLRFELPVFSTATGGAEQGQIQTAGVCLVVPLESGGRSELAYAASMAHNVFGASLANALAYSATRSASRLDPLTGLGRRHVFDEHLERAVATAARYGRELSVALIDVDRFKDINDRRGHAAGDAALCAVADALTHNVRRADIASRYGGDEFALLLPETSPDEALVVLRRIAGTLAKAPGDADGPHITLSMGVAAWQPGDSPADVVHRADAALYGAKRNGRNQVCTAGPAMPAFQSETPS